MEGAGRSSLNRITFLVLPYWGMVTGLGSAAESSASDVGIRDLLRSFLGGLRSTGGDEDIDYVIWLKGLSMWLLANVVREVLYGSKCLAEIGHLAMDFILPLLCLVPDVWRPRHAGHVCSSEQVCRTLRG